MMLEILFSIVAIYLLCGFLFAVPFVLVGVGKIDSHAAPGSWGFRVMITPGTMFFWPLLARRWVKGTHQPPEERNAHRSAAKPAGRNRKSAIV